MANSKEPSIIAYVTLDRERVIQGPLALVAKNEEEQKMLSTDIAKAMKANVSQLHCGDYIIIK